MSGTPLSDEEMGALRKALQAQRPLDKSLAIHRAALAHAAAALLVPDLTALLVSDEYVPCTSLKYEFSGHDLIAFSAMQAIESIGVPPGIETLRTLLADRRVFELPEASYDQGAYIGDYGTDYVAPAALGARLVPMLGTDGFLLAPDLATNAVADQEIIWKSAILALGRLSRLVGEASRERREALARAVHRLFNLPEAIGPSTHRGFELRDLGRLLQNQLSKPS